MGITTPADLAEGAGTTRGFDVRIRIFGGSIFVPVPRPSIKLDELLACVDETNLPGRVEEPTKSKRDPGL